MTSLPATHREMVLGAGATAVLLFAVANYLANHVRPLPRLAYTSLVVLLFGMVIPAIALGRLIQVGVVPSGTLAAAPIPIATTAVIAIAVLAGSLRREPADARRRAPALFIGLALPSLAEVVVFVGLTFNTSRFLAAPLIGDVAAVAAATIITSVGFSLYHLTHRPPWNDWRVLRTLFIVWLLIGACYGITRNLWAAALLNSAFATIGFVRNDVDLPARLPVIATVVQTVAGLLAVAFIAGVLSGT